MTNEFLCTDYNTTHKLKKCIKCGKMNKRNDRVDFGEETESACINKCYFKLVAEAQKGDLE